MYFLFWCVISFITIVVNTMIAVPLLLLRGGVHHTPPLKKEQVTMGQTFTCHQSDISVTGINTPSKAIFICQMEGGGNIQICCLKAQYNIQCLGWNKFFALLFKQTDDINKLLLCPESTSVKEASFNCCIISYSGSTKFSNSYMLFTHKLEPTNEAVQDRQFYQTGQRHLSSSSRATALALPFKPKPSNWGFSAVYCSRCVRPRQTNKNRRRQSSLTGEVVNIPGLHFNSMNLCSCQHKQPNNVGELHKE